MQRRGLIFFALAIFFTLGTIMIARSWLANEHSRFARASKPVRPSVSVLVAAHDLGTGSFVRPEDLRWQAWPNGQIAANYLRRGQEPETAVVGAVVRSRIAAGQPVTLNRVLKPGDRGFLAAVLAPGMRAVSVPVTAISDVSGLVFPGDHVDLVLAYRVKPPGDANGRAHVASETVLKNLRVLAIDQSTNDAKNGKPKIAKTVTFEVTPKQVQVIEVASKLGELYLSLRGLTADGKAAAKKDVRSISYTLDSEVSPLIPPIKPADAMPTITILRGSASGAPSGGFGGAGSVHGGAAGGRPVP